MSFSDAINPDPDPLARFDAAGGEDLSQFDAADGATAIPAGWYTCTVAQGEVVTTKTAKPAYRLAFDVADDPHRGFRLWRYYVLDTLANANRAKAALAPFGLTTSAALKAPFPGPRTITAKVLVAVQTRADGTTSNDVVRFKVVDTATNPHAVNPTRFAGSEGGPA